MEFPNSDFWNYSSQLWTLPGVEKVCLELQNEHQADVNILLYCCWLGDQKRSINSDHIPVLLDALESWLTIIKPLRESRKLMQQSLIAMPPSMVDQTLNNISEMELNAEHMAQLALEKALTISQLKESEAPSELACSLANLLVYCNTLETTDLKPQLSELLNGIYQDEEAMQAAMMESA